ncbi:MAG: hypothetical protein QGD94_04530, partial [Planctomycetia bacterium]|nr:hypothetical protein [Planctomycetia bacterium]
MNRTVRWISIIFILVVIGVPLADVISNPQVHLEDLFKLGIDLQGGTSLIYELRAMEEQVEGGATVDASDAASVIVQRIDPQGLKNYVVRPMGKSRLEIVLPGRRVRVRISDEETTDEVMRAEAARLVAPGDGKTPAVPEDWQKFTGGITLNVDLEPPLILADIQDKIADAVRERHPDKLDVPWIVPGTKEKDASLKFRHIRVWIAEPYSGAARAVWSQLVSRALAEHTDLARVKRLVAQSGHLEFRMLVGRTISAKTKWDQLVADRRAGKPLESSIYRWYPVKIKRRGLTKERRKAAFENSVGEVSGSNAIYVDDPESLTLDVLVNVGDGQNVTGADMQFAKRYSTGEDGPVVLFGMKPKSTERFRTLMGQKNVGKHIAIILDGVVQSYPVLKTRLHDGGIISGYKGRPHERDEVVTLLNSGRIEASIYGPISERTVGPELGQDNIRKGRDAMIIGSIVVVAFMIIYYLGAGVVAVFALVLEITLVIMGMHWMDGTWTLPGIAGLVLTVGMSVDANVLIF